MSGSLHVGRLQPDRVPRPPSYQVSATIGGPVALQCGRTICNRYAAWLCRDLR
jgi:hypothetical protein